MITPGREGLFGSKGKSIKIPKDKTQEKTNQEVKTQTSNFPNPDKVKFDIESGAVFMEKKNPKIPEM